MPIVDIICEPHKPSMSLKEFVRTAEPHTIALDGAVKSQTMFDIIRKIAVIDHHSGVFRAATNCCASQVVEYIRYGDILETFKRKDGKTYFKIRIDDADQDVIASIFFFRYPEMAKSITNPLLNRLLYFLNKMDVFGGSYPFQKDAKILREIAYIFYPYTNARMNGLLDKRDPKILLAIIDDCCNRMMQYLVGNGQELVLELGYKLLGKFENWTMVEEIGQNARIEMASDGIKTFLSVKKRDNGRYNYVLSTVTFSHFNLHKIFKMLNKAEGCVNDCWGGSDTIGGSPRVSGSKLTPDEVAAVINKYYQKTLKEMEKHEKEYFARQLAEQTSIRELAYA